MCQGFAQKVLNPTHGSGVSDEGGSPTEGFRPLTGAKIQRGEVGSGGGYWLRRVILEKETSSH
jgi:hypothetical protein